MNNLIETIEYKGHEINVYFDEGAFSPDDNGDEQVFVVYNHRQFCIERNGFNPGDIFEAMKEGKKTYKGYWFFPVYAYIHSGVALSLGRNEYPFTCGWDTSFSGFVLVERSKGWTWKEDQAYNIAETEIESWNMYLSGDVYGYDSDYGSCWGFYGEEQKEGMIEEAKAEIDHAINKQIKQHFNQLKTFIKNHVPYQYRNDFELAY